MTQMINETRVNNINNFDDNVFANLKTLSFIMLDGVLYPQIEFTLFGGNKKRTRPATNTMI